MGVLSVTPSSTGVQVHAARVLGRYLLFDEIAAGGMATVHIGRLVGPAGFSRTVAIKRLHPQFAKDPQFVAMFLDEARIAARIRHPNVVSTLDVVALEGELFLVMDFVQGESLSRLLRAAKRLGEHIPPKIVSSIMTQALLGLHAAHEATSDRGDPLCVVHRDVSPQNILVGADGIARVVDFGVAKAVARAQTTEQGKIKGKLSFMAPEQLRQDNVDRRADIFAAAAVLWEALTGRRLFQGENTGAIVTQILMGHPDPPSQHAPEVSRAVDAIVLRGLATRPSDRFATAREMAQALEAALPPAGSLEVGGWVEKVAGEVLKLRSEKLTEVESSSTVEQLIDSTRLDAPAASLLESDTPSQPSPERSNTSITGGTIAVPREVAAHRSRVPIFAIAGAVVVVGAASLWWARHATSRAPAAPAAPDNAVASQTDRPTSSSPGLTAPEPVEAAAESADSPRVASLPSASASSNAAPRSSGRSAGQKPPQDPGSKPKRNCDPPYVLEADGSKRFKAECF